MTSPDRPACYRVVITEHAIDENRFAVSAEDAATAAAEDHDLDALLEPVRATVAEVPGGERRRYVIRASPALMYEAELEGPRPRADKQGRRENPAHVFRHTSPARISEKPTP